MAKRMSNLEMAEELENGGITLIKKPRHITSMSQTLDLHSPLPTQGIVMSSRLEKINPLNSIVDSKFVQFRYSTAFNDLINPARSCIYIKGKIDLGGSDKSLIIPVNGLGGALFKNLVVKLNNTIIESGDGLYAYRADLEKRLLYPSQVQEKGMCLSLFDRPETSFNSYNETSGDPWGRAKPTVVPKIIPAAKVGDPPTFDTEVKLETETDLQGAVVSPKESILMRKVPPHFKNRVQYCTDGQDFEIVDTIHSDLFNQDRHLPPNSTIDLSFDLQDNQNFFLLSHTERGNRKFILESFQFWVRVDTIEPPVALDMIKHTEEVSDYLIPIRHVDMNYFTRTPQISDLSETAALLKKQKKIPRRVFIGVVRQDAFHGNIKKDPFHYEDLSMENVLLRTGGQQRPLFELKAKRSALTPTQDNITQFLFSLHLATGTFLSRYTTGIDYFNWFQGNAILGFDLTSGDSEQVNEYPATHNMELYYHLQKELTTTHVMIIYAEYDSVIRINKLNEVSIED